MTTVLDLRGNEDIRDHVQRAVQSLAEGNVVCLPTETVYGLAASALHGDAVERLVNLKGRDPNQPLALAVKSAEEALDYLCDSSELARRLARRCWPGPVTLVLPCKDHDSAIQRLPENVRRYVVSDIGYVGIRVVAHPAIEMLLRYCVGPLVLTSANLSGQPPAISGTQAIQAIPEGVSLLLDDGPSRYGGPSTVVRVDEKGWKVLREGVVEKTAIEQFAQGLVLIVCTGNTCRSPMGEVLLRQRLEKRRPGAAPRVVSAGLAAASGCPASAPAIEVTQSLGLDLTNHRSRALDESLVKSADLILTMTGAHREGILSRWPEVADRTHCLCNDGGDVVDPVGGPLEMYQQCAELIDRQLDHWCEQLAGSDDQEQGPAGTPPTDKS